MHAFTFYTMEVGTFLRNFILSKLIRKFHQVAMVIFVGTVLGQIPTPIGIIGTILFFLAYLSTYLYNDLIDYEDDKTKKSVYREKALVLGYATPRDFLILLGNATVIFTFLVTLWDPMLGFFTVISILLNNLRTHVVDTTKRQILLILVELFNFEAIWQAFFGAPIPAVFIPLFIAYSSIYAFGHGVYRMRKAGTFDNIVKTRELRNLFVISVLALLFSLPALFLSVYHFAFLVIGLVVYALPMLRIVTSVELNKQEGMNKIDENHHKALTVVGLVLLLGAVLYILYGSPFNVYIPIVAEYTDYYIEVSSYFDRLQSYIVERMFGDLRGVKDVVEDNTSL